MRLREHEPLAITDGLDHQTLRLHTDRWICVGRRILWVAASLYLYRLGLLLAGFTRRRFCILENRTWALDAEHRVSFSDDGCICVVSDSSYHAHSLAWGAREFVFA